MSQNNDSRMFKNGDYKFPLLQTGGCGNLNRMEGFAMLVSDFLPSKSISTEREFEEHEIALLIEHKGCMNIIWRYKLPDADTIDYINRIWEAIDSDTIEHQVLNI